MAEYVELDLNIEPCQGCGTLTANPWLLCVKCTDAETDDKDFNRASSNVDGGPLG